MAQQGWKGQSSAPVSPQQLQESSFPAQGLEAAPELLEKPGQAIPFGKQLGQAFPLDNDGERRPSCALSMPSPSPRVLLSSSSWHFPAPLLAAL